jgi:hypothetical protein
MIASLWGIKPCAGVNCAQALMSKYKVPQQGVARFSYRLSGPLCGPLQECQVAAVRELYAQCTSEGDAEALQALQKLVDDRHSSAACLALAKVRRKAASSR